MKPSRLRRPAALAGLCLALLVMAASSGCEFVTSRSQIARALLWWDADVDDIGRFPARRIPRGGDVRPWVEGSLRGYDTLMSPVRLAGTDQGTTLDTFLAEYGSTAFLVVRGDTLLYERYFNGFRRDSIHTTFSVSKSILAAAVGAAIDRDHIASVEDPITRYVPELLERDSAFASITLHHLLTMSSGLAWSDVKTPWGDPADTYYSTDLRAAATSADIADSPGARFVYNNYNPLLVGLALERAVGTTVSAFVSETIWGPMGAEADASWSLDRAGYGFEKMESGFNARARDLARFGALYRDGGRALGAQVLPRDWVEASVRVDSVGDPAPHYQYFWWIRPQEFGSAHFWAEGRFGQFIYVVPDLDLVMVRLGRDDGGVDWRSFLGAMARRVRAAVKPMASDSANTSD